MLSRLWRGYSLACGILDYQCILGEAPGVEDGIPYEVRDLAVGPQAAGFHGEVHGTGAHILGWGRAGDDLKLIDCVDAHVQGDQAVVALLADGLRRNAIEIELAEEVAGSADDRKARATLRSGRQGAKRGWIALCVVHLQREVGVGLIFYDEAARCRRGIEHGQGGGDLNRLRRLANGDNGVDV